MPEPEDKNKTTPKPNNRAVTANQVTVRVIGKQPIAEGGNLYQPARKEAGKQIPADTFKTSAERAEALGDHVEVIEETAPEAK